MISQLPSGGELFEAVMKFLIDPFTSANCSLHYSDEIRVGGYVNSSYDGAMGNLVREVCSCLFLHIFRCFK